MLNCPSVPLLQVVERLFSLLSDCMWEAPVAQAKHLIQIKEKVQELKVQVCEPFCFVNSIILCLNH